MDWPWYFPDVLYQSSLIPPICCQVVAFETNRGTVSESERNEVMPILESGDNQVAGQQLCKNENAVNSI